MTLPFIIAASLYVLSLVTCVVSNWYDGRAGAVLFAVGGALWIAGCLVVIAWPGL